MLCPYRILVFFHITKIRPNLNLNTQPYTFRRPFVQAFFRKNPPPEIEI